MKRGILILFVLIIGLNPPLFAVKVATFNEVLKPSNMAINDEYIYVYEGTTIHIYSHKDYKYVKKFGNEGEGPQEFKTFAFAIPQKDNLLINSLGKISYFTKTGEFIREIKAKGGSANNLFWPLKDGYVGRSSTTEKGTGYVTINLYDKELNKLKEIHRLENFNQARTRGKIIWPPRQIQYQSHDNRIYIAGKPGFTIDVLDRTGQALFTIEEKKYKRRKFTEEDKKKHLEFFKRQTGPQFEMVKQMMDYQEFFPEIAGLFIDNNYIYILTWKFKKDKFEFYEYDMNGKFSKRFHATIIMQGPLELYPVGIKNGLLYQLIETENEDWDLHITTLVD